MIKHNAVNMLLPKQLQKVSKTEVSNVNNYAGVSFIIIGEKSGQEPPEGKEVGNTINIKTVSGIEDIVKQNFPHSKCLHFESYQEFLDNNKSSNNKTSNNKSSNQKSSNNKISKDKSGIHEPQERSVVICFPGPGREALTVCRDLEKDRKTLFNSYLLVITGDVDDTLMTGLGVQDIIPDDFLTAGCNESELLLRLKKAYREAALSYEQEINIKNREIKALYEKLEGEMKKARRLHEKSLPAVLPEIKGVRIAANYHPSWQLGGDFYNIFKVDHGLMDMFFEQYVLFISDVTGHGLDSTIISIFIKDSINGYFALKHQDGEALSPRAILEHLMEQFIKEGYPEDYFACVLLGIMDLKLNEFIYSSAGFQVPPLAMVPDGRLEELECGGLPISSALMPEMMFYAEKTVPLKPGLTVLLSTDGLFEQEECLMAAAAGEKGADEETEEDDTENGMNCLFETYLKDMFEKYYYLPPETLKELIYQEMLRFSGGREVNDDITYIVLQVDMPGAEDDLKMEMSIASTMEGLEEANMRVRKFLEPHLPDADMVLIGFHEMVANAVEHGNSLMADQQVIINGRLSEQYLLITVEDQGEGFDWYSAGSEQLEMDGEEERGRGLIMATACFDLIVFNEKGNRTSLIKTRQ